MLYQVISSYIKLYPMCGIYTPDQLKLGFPLHILGIGSAAVGQTWQSSVRGEGGGYRRSTGKLGRTTHQ